MTTIAEHRRKDEIGHAADYERAALSFKDFLDFVYIMEPPPGRGRILFEMWPHLAQFAKDLGVYQLLIVAKARQNGFSWIVAAYAIWMALFKEGAVVLKLSRGETESHALLGKAKSIYLNLPKAWVNQTPLGSDSRSELSFPRMSSKIMALPATEDAGRSETASLVIQDEAEFHEYLASNYQAVQPTIGAGGQHIMGSTFNKRKAVSMFKEICRDAPGNGWHLSFWGWRLRKGRDDKWYSDTLNNIPTLALEGLTPEVFMAGEYPGSIEEGLAPVQAQSAFDHEALVGMQADQKAAVKKDGPVSYYQMYRTGRRYIAGTDVSKGSGYDYGVSVVIDSASGYVVADIMSKELSAEELVYHSSVMLEEFKRPIWAIEDNGIGEAAILAAQRLNYPRLFKRKTGKNATHTGWHTDQRSRYLLWGELTEAVRARMLTVPNKDGLGQFFNMMNNNGEIQALKGAHDDYPMAVGIAWQMRKHAYSSGTGAVVTKPRSW